MKNAGLLIICLLVVSGSLFLLGSSAPAQNIKGWEPVVITDKNTKVWCLAREAAGGEYNIQDVVILIRDKNPWLIERNYALKTGDRVLVPVF